MEGIWPVLIAVGISVVISLLKKRPVSTEETGEELPKESPWDDLMREIERQHSRTPDPAPEPSALPIPSPSEAAGFPVTMPDSTEAESELQDTAAERISSESRPFNYDEQAVKSLEAEAVSLEEPLVLSQARSSSVSGEWDKEVAAEREFNSLERFGSEKALLRPRELTLTETSKPSPATREEKQEKDADSLVSSEELFAEGFDPRMAILYSEILHPKFKEY